MSLLIGLEAQPNFPQEDLSEQNAELLELMLANSVVIASFHQGAERLSEVYRVGHPALRSSGERLAALESRIGVFDHGVSAYETIAALVLRDAADKDIYTAKANAAALQVQFSELKLAGYIDDATQRFRHELPRATQVIQESSERYYHALARYAVIGAAFARQFELDAA